jgi:hypothetical protein
MRHYSFHIISDRVLLLPKWGQSLNVGLNVINITVTDPKEVTDILNGYPGVRVLRVNDLSNTHMGDNPLLLPGEYLSEDDGLVVLNTPKLEQ